MAKRVQRRRGSTSEHGSFTGAVGEITVDLDKDTVVVHDGAQAGGFPLAREDMNNVTNRVGVQQLACNEGTNGQVLSTNGSGTLSFSSVDATTAVVGGDLSGTVGNAQIVANAVTTTELAANAVTTAKIADQNVGSSQLGTNSVTTIKITDANVTTAKIADSAITSNKILDGTIVAGDLASNAVTAVKILDGNVTADKIAANAITNGKIADGTIVNVDIANTTITGGKLVNSTITDAQLAANAVTTVKIIDDAVTIAKLAATGTPSSSTFLRGDNSWATVVGVPAGVITLWSGATNAIPSGWVLCDGSNSTPDLTSRFIVGAGGSYAVGATGGSTTTGAHTLTIAEMPAHTHSYTHKVGGPNGDDNQHQIGVLTAAQTGSTGGGGSHTHANSLPPYYALAYIMKT